MKGEEEEGFPDVSEDPFKGGKAGNDVPNPFREEKVSEEGGRSDDAAEEPPDASYEGNGHPEPEDGTLSQDEMNNLSEYDEKAGEDEGG